MPVFAWIGIYIILQAGVMAIARPHPRVQSATPTGTIVGHVSINDRPAPNVRIVLKPFAPSTSDIRILRTVTDEKGNYRFTDVPDNSAKRQIINKHAVPPEIKILAVRHLQAKDWYHKLEFEIRNVSTKPIYFVLIYLILEDRLGPSGLPLSFTLSYGLDFIHF